MNIKKADGSFESVDVPAGVQRFDELKVGDKVSVTFNNNVSARLKPPGEAAGRYGDRVLDCGAGDATWGHGIRAENDDRDYRRAIDKNASSITFTGPNGWKYSRHIVDPAVLDRVKVGDKVDITWNTDVTVAVQ